MPALRAKNFEQGATSDNYKKSLQEFTQESTATGNRYIHIHVCM